MSTHPSASFTTTESVVLCIFSLWYSQNAIHFPTLLFSSVIYISTKCVFPELQSFPAINFFSNRTYTATNSIRKCVRKMFFDKLQRGSTFPAWFSWTESDLLLVWSLPSVFTFIFTFCLFIFFFLFYLYSTSIVLFILFIDLFLFLYSHSLSIFLFIFTLSIHSVFIFLFIFCLFISISIFYFTIIDLYLYLFIIYILAVWVYLPLLAFHSLLLSPPLFP